MSVRCQVTSCRGLRGKQWAVCIEDNCSLKGDVLDFKKCVQQNCNNQSKFLRRLCAVYKCKGKRDTIGAAERASKRKDERGSSFNSGPNLARLSRQRLAEFVRRGAVKGMWPDEFETRVAERGLWPDEYETRQLNEGSPNDVEALGVDKPEDLVRRTRSDLSKPEDTPEINGGKKKTIKKRWSTRLCMESHCKNANNKVQYFMCGKMHCHRWCGW